MIGLWLGISGTALRNYTANHLLPHQDLSVHTDDSQIFSSIKTKIQWLFPQESSPITSKFDSILKVLNEEYSSESGINLTGMREGALHGFVDGLGDPHTVYFDAVENSGFVADLKWEQDFEGIGAIVAKKPDGMQLQEVLKWSPSRKAGLKPLDLVVQIDGISTSTMTLVESIKKIRWPKGTTVSLTLYRPSTQEMLKKIITREKVVLPSVSSKTLIYSGKKIGYITISIIGEDTAGAFMIALWELKKSNIQGLILDLRGNGGGFLPIAVEIASHWIPRGQIITSTTYQSSPPEQFVSKGYMTLSDLPTVVLVDGYSASASEIIAAALREQKGIKLVGEKTFGKGSIQTLTEFDDGSSLKYTIGKRNTPKWSNINGIGLIPDEIVAMDIDAYSKNGSDTQLLRAQQLVANLMP